MGEPSEDSSTTVPNGPRVRRAGRRLRVLLLVALGLGGVLVVGPGIAVLWFGHSVFPGYERHASAPTLTDGHLRLIEGSLGVTFPAGSTLQHTAIMHAKDTVFDALITAPAAEAVAWQGPPPDRFRLSTDSYQDGPVALRRLPWTQRTFPPVSRVWYDRDATTIWLSVPDENGTAYLIVRRGGAVTKFPQGLHGAVPGKP